MGYELHGVASGGYTGVRFLIRVQTLFFKSISGCSLVSSVGSFRNISMFYYTVNGRRM